MTTAESPTMLRRRLGSELRSLREHKGMTSEQLAVLMEWDRTKVSRIERGNQKIRPKEIREVLAHLNVTDPEVVGQYEAMARESKKRGWWTEYGPLPKVYDTYVGLESSATEIRCWELYVVNGLMQTPGYARAIISAPVSGLSHEQVDQQVKIRLERQERLSRIPKWVVMDESVLHRVIGDRDIQCSQLDHLLHLGRVPGITLQILPFDEGAHGVGRGSITTLNLEDGTVVYVDTLAGQIFPEGEQANACSIALEHVYAKALSPKESAALIRSVRASM
jgi:transcriptional regulator with XRE-family HTH domain